MEPGTRLDELMHRMMTASAPTASRVDVSEIGVEVGGDGLHAADEIARHFLDLQAEEVLDLRAGDEDGDAVGEPDDDRAGDELDRRAEAGQPQG